MKHFLVIPNEKKPASGPVANHIREYLTAHGATCEVYEGGTPLAAGYRYTDGTTISNGIECAIVLGGDGTLIQAAHDLQDHTIPILGVNLGTLGYLAEVDIHGVEHALHCLLHDAFFIEERMMIEGDIVRDGQVIFQDIAVNDIVLCRNGSLRVVRFHLHVDGEYLSRYQADGMIVSTPTGSTAYSLSAGGPIVMPTSSLLVLTPICPHTINGRSIVLPAEAKIELEIEIPDPEDRTARVVCFDADQYSPLKDKDRVVIRKSSKILRLAKLSKISFLETLRRKMSDI